MNNPLSIQFRSPATVTDLLPQHHKDDWLPGSTPINASGLFGDISLQGITVSDMSMYYVLAVLQQDIILELTGASHYFFVQIQLSGTCEVLADTFHYVFRRENHYSMLSLNSSGVQIKLSVEKAYKSVVLVYPLSFILSLLYYFPWLDEWQEKIYNRQTITCLDTSLSVVLSEKIYRLLHTPFAPLMEEFYTQTLQEIAKLVLSNYVPVPESSLPFNLYDVSCIRAAKEYADTHLLEHLTIGQLARKVGINQLKLKKGFKILYGFGVYGYRLEQRMINAKAALEKTAKPIHQIARQSGYRNAANFSSAFKKKFGISPYQYRQKNR